MAHKKAAWSAKNLRDSNPKYRWLKLAWWQFATAWNIIVRQKGDVYKCGLNTYKGKDYTIHAAVDGVVTFRKKKYVRFDWRKYLRTVVEITPAQEQVSVQAPVKKQKPVTSATTTDNEKKETTQHDDLTRIAWIDQTIAWLLVQQWVVTYADLSTSKVWDLRALLKDNWLEALDPALWKKQATLAKNWKWDELAELQKEIA